MRYGYFLAEAGTEHGDTFLSSVARRVWVALGHACPTRVDGVSVWEERNGFVSRTIARDFFRDKEVRYPPGEPFRIPISHIDDHWTPHAIPRGEGK